MLYEALEYIKRANHPLQRAQGLLQKVLSHCSVFCSELTVFSILAEGQKWALRALMFGEVSAIPRAASASSAGLFFIGNPGG